MTGPRVLGYVMARDEWPLLALAVTHALSNHVDHVLVVDHASEDETRNGMELLEREWPERLSVYRLDDPAYLQEAATTVIAQVGDFAAYDWVYVFDADEFLLTPNRLGLHEVLADVTPDVVAIRYEIHNWVAPYSFDDTDLSRYPEIRHRARPNVFMDFYGEILADEIEHGFVNFFDVPFGSKVIARGGHSTWIQAGAHNLKHPGGVREVSLPPSRVRAGHVPLLSRRRLDLKCHQGQALIEAGLHPAHGWLSQMMHRLDQRGRLEAFWCSHSVGEARPEVGLMTPTTEPDDALAEALEPSLHKLTGQAGSTATTHSVTSTAQSQVPLGAAVQTVRRIQEICDAAVAAQDAAVAAHDVAVAQRDAAVAERDAAVTQRDVAVVQMDAAVATRDAAVAERDAAVTERDAAVTERDAAVTERDAILASRTWRWTAPYRTLRARLRAHSQR